MSTRVRSVRASENEWLLYAAACKIDKGRSLNMWIRGVLNLEAARVLAAEKRRLDEIADRERLKAAMRG